MKRRSGYPVALLALALAALLGIGCGSSDAPSAPTIPGTSDTFPSGDIRLAYTLDLPAGPGPFPAIVMGHGSGEVTRQQMVSLALGFVQAGFAVLRYDK